MTPLVRTLSTGEAEEAEVLKFLLALQRQVAVHYSARAVVVEEAAKLPDLGKLLAIP